MSRYHYWQFLINSEGQPIPDANISVHLSGPLGDPANVYFDEFGYDHSNVVPQIVTNNMGYFEFWVGDSAEEFGYVKGQKFKLSWEKPGVALGEIDYIDIFPQVIEVDETDPDSVTKNKVINNKLAYRWEEHRNYTVQASGFPIHGIEAVNYFDTNDFSNKVISNFFAKQLYDHSVSIYSGEPHGILPLNSLLQDNVFNKLISNKIIYDINGSIDSINDRLDLIDDAIIEMGNAGNIFVPHPLNDVWTIDHNFGVKYVSVTIYGPDDKEIVPIDVELVNLNTVTIRFEEPVSGYAVITGNVIENTPGTPPFVIEGDHGSLTGLLGDDHTQYMLTNGTRGFTGTVSGVDPIDYNDLVTKYYADNLNLDHSSLLNTFIGDDHIQYIHIDGRRGFINPIKGETPVDPSHLTTKEYVDSLVTVSTTDDWLVITTSFTASTKKKYIVDTSGGPVIATLPATAINGSSIKFIDGSGFDVNSLTIDRNGNTIEGYSENLIVNTTNNKVIELIFYNNNWIIA